ncbi:uncharacterized protein LOC115924116 [Strongylocentrotus purpuratus]|uniref:CUB domain-containing protein n=1 Tax=Strongylocentrotus purpuratus TaxID=7668 RepID=A0A7M7SZ05_STRPU|nr:uncharacterized protein LOC115924116 [Strongylocentrotus purpuratus]
MEDYLTTLVSPDFPDHYPPKTRREWSFDIPPGAMGHIKVNILQVEHFWDPLTLTHSSETAHGTNVTTFPLVSGNLTSLLLPEGVVTVRFCSDGFLLHPGFAFEVRTLRSVLTGVAIPTYAYSIDINATDGMTALNAMMKKIAERDWQPFWVNATKAWNKDNIDITANKAVIL